MSNLTKHKYFLMYLLLDNMFCEQTYEQIVKLLIDQRKRWKFLKLRECHIRHEVNYNIWLEDYNNITFYQLFKIQKTTFRKLLQQLVSVDSYKLITKKYRGGRYPIEPEKCLLVFLWYMSNQDKLLSIGDRFNIVPSSVMQIVNVFLYMIIRKKKKYIYWPKTIEEYEHIKDGFITYPGVVGCVDGTHVNIKVPADQQDSYINRYQGRSINLMGICTSNKIFTYIFVGYPGSAHDSRVFSNSLLFRQIEGNGKHQYFPRDEYHIIGDSAFPLRTWLMTPFKNNQNLNRMKRHHNYCLSSARVCIENTFAILKNRWARIRHINTNSISKAIEIVTASCILHNFCYFNGDEWELQPAENNNEEEYYVDDDREERRLGEQKRNHIAETLMNN